MTSRDLAMLLSTTYILYPPLESWGDVERWWKQTPAKERRHLESKAKRMLRLHSERSKT